MKLVIANKNYSSWSLRPWLLLSTFEIEFEEIKLSLLPLGLSDRLGQYSPTKKVPVLIDGELTVFDSLAICEYISEQYLNGLAWPKDINVRAEARSICAEMHSGFFALRGKLPMNCRAKRNIELTEDVKLDIARIDDIWFGCRTKYSKLGPWLFGEFSIADCFFAPVALRFSTYQVSMSDISSAYMNFVLGSQYIVRWIEDATREVEIILPGEVGDEVKFK